MMKIEFQENPWGADINLTPETPAEVAQLLRLSRNAKAVKPTIYMTFRSDPVCYINIEKVKESVQVTGISNKKP